MNPAVQAALLAVSAFLSVALGVEAAEPAQFHNQRTQSPRDWRLSPRGFGPIVLGAPLENVTKTSGVSFKRNRIEDSPMLDYVLKSDPGALNVSVCPAGPLRGQIMTIAVYKDWLLTDRGIHLHDPADKLRQAYGRLLKPVDAGQYAKFYTYFRYDGPRDARYSVLFTVSRTDPNRDRVTAIAASMQDSRCAE